MKINKCSRWIYTILMLMPFIWFGISALIFAFTRSTISTSITDNIGVVLFNSTLSELSNTFNVDSWLLFDEFSSFANLVVYEGINDNLVALFTYWVDISLIYLAFEVIMTFISIARNLINSFVNTEF